MYIVFFVVILPVVIFLLGVRIVRPTHKGLVERLGKYRRFADPGFNWIIPGVDRMIQVNTTEQMVDAQPQEIITNDNLNARVDAQVYFRVKDDEASVLGALYSIGISKDSILEYETAIKSDKFLVVAHGTPDEVTHAQQILSNTSSSETQLHMADAPIAARK